MKRIGLKPKDVILISMDEPNSWESTNKVEEIRNALERSGKDYEVVIVPRDIDITVLGKAIQKPEDEFLEEV